MNLQHTIELIEANRNNAIAQSSFKPSSAAFLHLLSIYAPHTPVIYVASPYHTKQHKDFICTIEQLF